MKEWMLLVHGDKLSLEHFELSSYKGIKATGVAVMGMMLGLN